MDPVYSLTFAVFTELQEDPIMCSLLQEASCPPGVLSNKYLSAWLCPSSPCSVKQSKSPGECLREEKDKQGEVSSGSKGRFYV
jgi:hypothetical protein